MRLKNLMASPNASQRLESTEIEEIGRDNTEDYIGAPINLTMRTIRSDMGGSSDIWALRVSALDFFC